MLLLNRGFVYPVVAVVIGVSEVMAQVPAPGAATPRPDPAVGRTTFGPAGPAPVATGAAPVAVAAPAVVPAPGVAGEVTVSGQVLRTKQVDLRGTTEKNLVALVDAGGGQQQIVELGLAANFKATPVYTGDPIVAAGSRVRIGQLDVLAASRVTVSGKEIPVVRETRAAAVAVVPKLGYPVTEQIVKIEGKVNRLRSAPLAGLGQEHLLAEIVTRGGQAIVTDLGPPQQIWRADVKQGEWITIRGQEMEIDNRPVLLALEINKNGVPVMVDRHLVRAQPTEIVPPAAAVETAAVVRRPAVVSPPTTLVPGTTVEQTTPVEVVPPRVSPPLPVVP